MKKIFDSGPRIWDIKINNRKEKNGFKSKSKGCIRPAASVPSL